MSADLRGTFEPSLTDPMKPMRTNRWPMLLLAVGLLAACGGNETQQDALQVDDGQGDATRTERVRKTKNIFFNIPSPMETAALLKKAGAEYNGKILNDVKNVNRYTSSTAQALNLGIYGADLSYTSVFNQTQESMLYTACAQNLAKRLNVSHAFDQSTVDRMERNRNDRDSLLSIISETYWDVDAYLKDNERENLSGLMIAGGWIEGLYIATQVTLTNDSPELRQRIAEQKLSLGDLVGLMGTYPGDETSIAKVKADLEALNKLFTDVTVESSGESTITQEEGMTVVGGAVAMASLSDAQLVAIRDKAAQVRNTYIN